MDPEAARRARRRTFKADLLEARTDEEACPPEWADLMVEVDRGLAALRAEVVAEARCFAAEPDIRVALQRQRMVDASVRRRVAELVPLVRRLNLLAPLARFQRPVPDAEEILRPLYRVGRGGW